LIEVRPDPAIKGNNCAVEIEMADGKKFASFCEHPRGSFENPLTREQIEAKFRTYAKGVITDAHAEEVIATVSRLEELSSVRRLMDLLRGSAAKAQAA
jgi:2-methylcitrate dehydratase PrpD